jgi:hypothetical protein
MFASGFRSAWIFFLLLVFTLHTNAFAAGKPKHPKAPAKQEQPTPPPAPVAPPPELTLEQKPAVPPRVTYQNHQLTIVAENSTLGDILRAVKTQTGASIDLPANANSRVVIHLGPGPARDVLATLLNGTLFNYVLLGTENDPEAVGKIILTQKPTGPEPQPVATYAPPQHYAQQQNYYPPANPSEQGSEEPDYDSETDVEPPATDQTPQPGSPAGQTGPKTPEQLLQELQRQQLLQQLQRQQGNQPNQVPEQNPEQ